MTHQQAVSLAKQHLKKGNLQEAKNLYSIVLKQFPADKLAKKELKKIELAISKEIKLNIPKVKINYLTQLYSDGKVQEAINEALRLKEEYPKSVLLLNMLGVFSKSLCKYDDAIFYYTQAISLKDDFADAHYNLANTLSEIGETKEAISSYRTTIKLQHNHAKAYNNLGTELRKIGQIKEALESYKKALKIDQKFDEAISNILPILIQLNQLEEIKSIPKPTYPSQLYKMNLSIYAFLMKQHEYSQILIEEIRLVLYEDTAWSDETKKFIYGYINFLSTLNPIMGRISSNINEYKTIYHIGESHSLSFAHHNVTYDDTIYTIQPLMIIGAKAWHLQNSKKNNYTSFFKYHIDSLQNNSRVLLSFGEIDCRQDEGIISYYKKTNEDLEEIIFNTVNKYINFTQKHLKLKNIQAIYMGIPAPIIDKLHLQNTDIQLRIKIVKLFNRYLLKISKDNKVQCIDIYKLTKDENGISNKKYMCDLVHLHPNTINKLKFDFENNVEN